MTGDHPQTPEHPPRSHTLLISIALLTTIRLLVAALTPLSPDEAYYWIWSRAPALGYLDHPFMVALWIRLGTSIIGETPLGIRLLAPLATAAGSLLLAQAANRLYPHRRPGLQAAILLNATLLFGVGAVTMTPDTPLLFFWTASIWALSRLVSCPRSPSPALRRTSGISRPRKQWASGPSKAYWLLAGATSGLALDSKYTAALLGIGIALWLLTPAMRPHLRTPWPWLGGLLATLTFLPTLLWNAEHGWASFAKQGGRTAAWDPARALHYTAELIAGQLGLATPLIAALFLLGTIAAARQWRSPAASLPAALILPGAAVFLQHALGDRVQANWVAILYPGAALATAGFTTRFWHPAATLGFTLTALLYCQATWSPLPLPRTLDPTLRTAGWDQLTTRAETLASQEGATFLASEEYGTASLLAWSSHTLPVIAAGPRWTDFNLPAPTTTSGSGLLLTPSHRREPPDPAFWLTTAPAGTLLRERAGLPIEEFRLYRVTPRPNAPAALLPSRATPPVNTLAPQSPFG